MSSKKIEWIIFDLGGVLVELIGVPTMLEWTGHTMTVEELWRKWLESPSVRAFERGNSSPVEFAKNMVSEFSLPVNDKVFLETFITWPKGLYPGVVEMLSDLHSSYKIGSFSNTNPLH
ncbi:HAD family phosphatase, partial [bacterium]|nr:HAD family phosphatase [bacterium]